MDNKHIFEQITGLKPNKDAVYRSVLSEMANSRQGTHSTKSRGMVRGGGKKPWKQKGRGVARAGTNRSPIWRGGGTVFGPEPHKYEYNLPKKYNTIAINYASKTSQPGSGFSIKRSLEYILIFFNYFKHIKSNKKGLLKVSLTTDPFWET